MSGSALELVLASCQRRLPHHCTRQNSAARRRFLVNLGPSVEYSGYGARCRTRWSRIGKHGALRLLLRRRTRLVE